MDQLNQLKEKLIHQIDHISEELIELSTRIHQNPETAFQEYKASKWITELLDQYNFQIEKGIADLPTSFRATYKGIKETPNIGLLAEYDALPGIGHGCGHNIMAVAGPGAAIGLTLTLEKIPGIITVIGTPAEENGGGKALMAKKNIFNNLDFALLIHPHNNYEVDYQSLASQIFRVEFFGKPAHASSAPDTGINALEAMINSFNMLNALRQHLKPDVKIHGVITNGGEAYNVIPGYCSGEFAVRSADDQDMDDLLEKVLNVFQNAAKATGCTVTFDLNKTRYATMKTNRALAGIFAQNLGTLGLPVEKRNPKRGVDSSDIGNISHIVPTIQPYIKIADSEISLHTIEFREAAVSSNGQKGLLDAAKVMAMTTIDLLYDEKLGKEINAEFEREMKKT